MAGAVIEDVAPNNRKRRLIMEVPLFAYGLIPFGNHLAGLAGWCGHVPNS